MSQDGKFFGKYRGKVESNRDPNGLGRLQVSCAAVFGQGLLAWAMPCVPFAGPGVGFFTLPPQGANVWVEFEAGDPDYPIWAGCFWGEGESPVKPDEEKKKMIKTESITLTLSDHPGSGGFKLEVNPSGGTPLKMNFDAQGIEMSNGAANVQLTPGSVSLNNGALEVL